MNYKRVSFLILTLFIASSFISIIKIDAKGDDTNVLETDNNIAAAGLDSPITGGTITAQAIDAENTSLLYSWDENYGNP